jgi:hypothetical protein
MKAGEIQPAPSSPARETIDMPKPAGRATKSPERNSALADLGIEFGPSQSSPKTPARPERNYASEQPRISDKAPVYQKQEEEETKIGPVSFRSFGGRQGEPKKQEKQVKRKEINLSELRQALEESLSKKDLPAQTDEPEEKKEIVSDEGVVAPVIDKPATVVEPSPEELSPENIEASPPIKPKDELSERIEEEKEMDKELEEDEPTKTEKPQKNMMKPGEAVKL